MKLLFVRYETDSSFETNIVLNCSYTSIESNGILLQDDLLLHQSVCLLLKEVAFVDICLLKFLEIFLKVCNVLNDLLQYIVSRFSCVVLEGRTFTAEQLHLFLVVIEHLDGFF